MLRRILLFTISVFVYSYAGAQETTEDTLFDPLCNFYAPYICLSVPVSYIAEHKFSTDTDQYELKLSENYGKISIFRGNFDLLFGQDQLFESVYQFDEGTLKTIQFGLSGEAGCKLRLSFSDNVFPEITSLSSNELNCQKLLQITRVCEEGEPWLACRSLKSILGSPK